MKKLITAALVLFLATAGSASAATWNYTALGDSLAYGYGAAGNYGYVERYRDYLEADNGVDVELTNLGIPGWTSGDLLAALKKNSIYRNAIANSDVVTFDIGGNDFLNAAEKYIAGTCGGKKKNKCLTKAHKKFKSNFKKIISLIKKLNKKDSLILRSMNIYCPNTTFYLNDDFITNDKYPNDFAVINPVLTKINRLISKTCRSKKIPFADVHLSYNGSSGTEDPVLKGYIYDDLLHPNDIGYQIIADDFRSLGYLTSK